MAIVLNGSTGVSAPNVTGVTKVTAGDIDITGPSPLLTLTDNDLANRWSRLYNENGDTFIDLRNGGVGGQFIIRGFGSGVADEYARFDANGNFGINNTSPATALDVSGTVTANSYTETVFAVTGTTPVLDPANGGIQTWTLSAASTPTGNFSVGESMTLMIEDGTAYSITWPTMTWVNNGGAAPTLATSGKTVVALWNVAGNLYGSFVGNGS